MTDYLQKFSLAEKTAFVIGGLGLIGSEVSSAFAEAGARTIVLDLNNQKNLFFEGELNRKGYDVSFKTFNCADINNLDINFSNLIDEFGNPDIFINCSYPRTKDWGKSSFEHITLCLFQ